MLEIIDLKAKVEGKEILNGVNLKFGKGLHFLMGPNGTGKTTLARAISGDPNLQISGRIVLDGEDITDMPPEERFKRGLFLGFQIAPEIKGIRYRDMIEKSLAKIGKKADLDKIAQDNGIPRGLLNREINVGFSGGERKKMEMLQLLAFRPKYAILDEPDSGVDLDSLKVIGNILGSCKSECGMLVITHTGNLLKFATPDKVFILSDGRIVLEGGPEIIKEIENRGYKMVME